MSHELFYTSAPSGLKPGSKGFCTVAMTQGLSAQFAERLESLSGYRFAFEPGGPQAAMNPVQWAHWRVSVAGKTRSVLSRVASAGADYSGRSNKFAHHVIVEPGEQAPAGPAWLMKQPDVMEREWTGKPGWLTAGRRVPMGRRSAGICHAWLSAAGDAGWGGVLADAFLKDAARPAIIIGTPQTDFLSLFEEAMALLPESHRWQVTFATYFTDLPAGLTCAWRGILADGPVARDAIKQQARYLVIDLTRKIGAAPTSPLVELARSGKQAAGAPGNPTKLADDVSGLDEGFEGTPAIEPSTVTASNAPRKSLRDSPSGPMELAEKPDQSWMPPIEATVVDRARRKTVKKQSSRNTVIAVLWPLSGVMALGVGLMAGYFIRPVGPNRTANAMSGTTASAPADANKLAGDLLEQQKKTASVLIERDDAIRQLAAAQAEIQALRSRLQAPTGPAPTTQSSALQNPPAVSQPKGSLANQIDGFGNPGNRGWQVLLEPSKLESNIEDMEIKLISSTPDEYKAEADGVMPGFKVQLKKRGLATEVLFIDSSGPQTVATFSVTDAALGVEWSLDRNSVSSLYVLPVLFAFLQDLTTSRPEGAPNAMTGIQSTSILIKGKGTALQVLKPKVQIRSEDIYLTPKISFAKPTNISVGMKGLKIVGVCGNGGFKSYHSAKDGWKRDEKGIFFRDDIIEYGQWKGDLHFVCGKDGVTITSDLAKALRDELQGLPAEIEKKQVGLRNLQTRKRELEVQRQAVKTDQENAKNNAANLRRQAGEQGRTDNSRRDLEKLAGEQDGNAQNKEKQAKGIEEELSKNQKQIEEFTESEAGYQKRLKDLTSQSNGLVVGELELKYGDAVTLARVRLKVDLQQKW